VTKSDREAPGWLRDLADAAAVMDVPRVVRPPASGGRRSAVLVLFGDRAVVSRGDGHPAWGAPVEIGPASGPDLLFIQRNEGLRRHAGQPAFPGGKIEDSDDGPVGAALREAAEETGLDPAGVDVLTTLPELFIAHSEFRVVPVLAWWRTPSAVRPTDIGEVAAVERISVADLADPANRLMFRSPNGRSGPAFRIGPMLIWGFTAMITDRLLALGGFERSWDATSIRELPEGAALPDTVDFVRGDLLDLALVVVAAAFAVSGYRQGFIVGSLSFVGFVGGAVLGAEFGPAISRAVVGGQTQQGVVALVLLVSGAIIGQFVASSIGAAVRQSVTSPSSTTLDSVGGSAVSVLSMLLVAWAIGSVLVASSFSTVVDQVDHSLVLSTMDRIMPAQAKTMFSEFRRLVASGPFPQVFSGIGAERLFPVSAPDPAVLNSAGFQAAKSRVVKVQGTAQDCDPPLSIEGSGFVYAPQHVLTNAHVVAGVNQGQTVTAPDGTVYQAKVVLYDPQIDVAVLYVPGLNLTPLQFDDQGTAGSSAVVAGYPLNHSFTAVPARIGGAENIIGNDLYQTGQVTRQVFEIRAVVQEGNSGGPLLSPSGTVYGVVFSVVTGTADTGLALTAAEVANAAAAGATQTTPVSTQACDVG